MLHPDETKFLYGAKLILILAGFWNRKVFNNAFIQKMYVCYSMFMRFSIVLLIFLLWCELFRLIIYKYELSVIIGSLGVVVTTVKVLYKLGVYLKNDVFKIIDMIIEKEREVWASNDEEIMAIYRRKVRDINLYVGLLATGSISAVFGLYVQGISGNLKLIKYNNEHNTSIESHLMAQTLSPPNKLDYKYWWFALQTHWTWIGMTYNSVSHITYTVLLVFAATQMEILQIRFKNVFNNRETNDNRLLTEQVASLKSLIFEHQIIIKLTQDLNTWLRRVIMLEYFLSSMDLALIVAALLKDPLSNLLFNGGYSILLVAQIVLLGWCCNEIQLQSLNIGDAIYNSNWILLNNKDKKLLQIIIMRAQLPLKMSIGPLGPMTSQSTLLVVKVAYSYVSLMMK